MTLNSPLLEQMASRPRRWPEYLKLHTVVLTELLTAGLKLKTAPVLEPDDGEADIHRLSHTVTDGSSVEPADAK